MNQNALWVIIVILVVLALVGAPSVGVFHHTYGWAPSGGLGLVVLILVILLLLGRI